MLKKSLFVPASSRPVFLRFLFYRNGTDCFVAHNDACIVVAFRGTETRRRSGVQDLQNIIVDIKTDCDILLIDDPHTTR
jgi:hypothetical protein